MFSDYKLKRRALAASLLSAASIIATAHAQTGATREYNFEKTDLETALLNLAEREDLQVVFSADDVKGRQANALSGAYTLQQALSRLLAGTGMSYAYNGSDMVVIRVADAQPAVVQALQASPQRDEVSDRITVTGSRISRKDYTAQSPIVTLPQELFEDTGPQSIEVTLNQLPQFAATAGSSSSSQARGGRANADLRGLGIARTLVLFDGRRLQPSDPLGAVDLNTIPSALVENVEIITGGASAVYGSDAIAGVVNFRLNDDFEGVEFDAQYGITERGDGNTLDLSGVFGGQFADGRGNAMLSISFMDRQEVKRGDRAFFQGGGITAVLTSGLLVPNAANLPDAGVLNDVFARYGYTGAPLPANIRLSRNPDGTLFSGSPVANYRFPADNDPYVLTEGQVALPFGEYYPLLQPLNRYSMFGRVNYEITDNVEAYGQFIYTRYNSAQETIGKNQATTNPVYIPVTNPFLPDDLQEIAASRGNPDEPLLIYFNQGRFESHRWENTYNVGQMLGGFRGDLGFLDGGWDIYASYGRTEQEESRSGYTSRDAYLSLVNAPDGGVSICEGGLDPLAYEAPSDECLRYLMRTTHESTTLEQVIVEATAQGRAFTLPAGDVRFAAGLGFRRNEYEFNPDSQRFSTQLLAAPVTSPTAGSTQTKEFFLEFLIPVLRDMGVVNSFDIDAAYRFSDYDSIGGVHTYKAGGDLSLAGGFLLRGGHQRAIRAPSVGELYQPVEQAQTRIGRTVNGRGDPCDVRSVSRNGPDGALVEQLCLETGVPSTVIGTHQWNGTDVVSEVAGNEDLKEEVADTITAGLVWTSPLDAPLLENLSLSIDYYDIKVKDAVGLITGEVILQRCYNGQGDSNPTYDPDNYYCTLFQRDQSGSFAGITTPLLNLSGYRTTGVDGQIDWSMEAEALGLNPGWGAFSLNSVVSYMGRYSIQTLQGADFVNYAGTIGNAQIGDALSHPKWKTMTNFGYQNGLVQVALRWRWIANMDDSSNVGAENPTAPGVKSRNYFDLTGRLQLREGFELRGGVLNLTDIEPPEWTGLGATDPATYDLLGRRFYAGARMKF